MAMRDGDRVVIRLTADDRRALDAIRGPLGRATFVRALVRQAAAEAEGAAPPGGRDDALAALGGLGESDLQVARAVRRIENADKLARWRLIAGD